MPITGKNRKARPLHVWQEFQKLYAPFAKIFPKPLASESFASYLKRVQKLWPECNGFVAIIESGCTKDGSDVNQRNFLFAIDDLHEEITKLRNSLYKRYHDE